MGEDVALTIEKATLLKSVQTRDIVVAAAREVLNSFMPLIIKDKPLADERFATVSQESIDQLRAALKALENSP